MAITEKLSNIGDAIREKTGKTNKLSLDEMVEEISNIGVDTKPLKIIDNGVYQEDGYAYTPVIADFPEQSTNSFISENTNVDGSWKKPDEFPDLGVIELQENEVYYLCKNHLGARFWCIRVYYTGSLFFERGHMNGDTFVSDKVYDGNAIISGNYIACIFDDDMPEYIVIHVKSTEQLTQIPLSSLSSAAIINSTKFLDGSLVPNSYSRWTSTYIPILWRRANLPYAISITNACYYIEKDELNNINTKSKKNFSIASLYSTSYNLVEVHIDGCVSGYLTSTASTFANCYSLTRIDADIKNIVTSICTTIANMFQNNYSLTNIDVSGWDTSGVTTTVFAFAGLRRVKKITGIENLSFPKVTTFASTFADSWNLRQDNGTLDVSNWFKNKVVSPTSVASMFSGLRSVSELNIDGIDLSSCTTIASLFSNMFQLKKIKGDIIPPTIKCVSAGSVFNSCYTLKELPNLTGWNLSMATDVSSIFNNMWSIKSINTRGIIFPTVNSKLDTMFRYGYRVVYLDCSDIDMQYTNNLYTNIFSNMPQLNVLYPPKNIGKGNKAVNLSGSYSLSHESLLRVLENLAVVTSATTLTLGKSNLNILTDEEKAIATKKGWALA